MRLIPLTTAQAIETSELWLPFLTRCAARLANPLQAYLDEIESGECQVYLIVAHGAKTVGAGGTRVFDKANGRALEVNWAGGNGAALLAIVPQLEQFARSLGCTRIFIPGRKGWSRVLPRDYRIERITVGKAL
jgi:hypothetical protein